MQAAKQMLPIIPHAPAFSGRLFPEHLAMICLDGVQLFAGGTAVQVRYTFLTLSSCQDSVVQYSLLLITTCPEAWCELLVRASTAARCSSKLKGILHDSNFQAQLCDMPRTSRGMCVTD